ncbi:hypothetical protein AWV79_26860 [Cupriavidus sp. UYMMa02A]|nr:hypothetical protein AWV79_26860 [Cupriavidus sp. UYMMa02A]
MRRADAGAELSMRASVIFQPDYAIESEALYPSTAEVRIRNYDAGRLLAFWDAYRRHTTHNLTHRNCSSTVARLRRRARRLHHARLGAAAWLVAAVPPAADA